MPKYEMPKYVIAVFREGCTLQSKLMGYRIYDTDLRTKESLSEDGLIRQLRGTQEVGGKRGKKEEIENIRVMKKGSLQWTIGVMSNYPQLDASTEEKIGEGVCLTVLGRVGDDFVTVDGYGTDKKYREEDLVYKVQHSPNFSLSNAEIVDGKVKVKGKKAIREFKKWEERGVMPTGVSSTVGDSEIVEDKIINLLPYVVCVATQGGSITEYEPTKGVITEQIEAREELLVCGHKVYHPVKRVTRLPEEEPHIYYIVSQVVQEEHPKRTDLLTAYIEDVGITTSVLAKAENRKAGYGEGAYMGYVGLYRSVLK